MLPTNSSGERILLPFYLYCLAAAAVMLSRCLGRINPTLHVAGLYAAALAVLLLRIPLFAICWDNHEVEKLNQQYAEEARSTGVLYYCMDYDMEYTHSKAFSDDYFYEKYLESVGLYGVDGLQVYFYGEGRPEVYVGGQRMTSPAFPGDSGNWLLPLRDTVEYLGGTVEWVPGLTTVTLYGRSYSIHDDTLRYARHGKEHEGRSHDELFPDLRGLERVHGRFRAGSRRLRGRAADNNRALNAIGPPAFAGRAFPLSHELLYHAELLFTVGPVAHCGVHAGATVEHPFQM